ncbi:ATP-binding protein [Kitasatospora sp. NPDC056446]|uniref:ATP-binding protein n=1 Tax=Kitasatospora sp. NPDC056446 TaxID=3345819 RepID=UPI0036B7C60D
MSHHATTDFPADRAQAAGLRTWAMEVLRRLGPGLDEEQHGNVLDDVKLVLTELVANAIVHGCGGDRPDVKLTASLAHASGVVHVSVSDPGLGRPECRQASNDATCGRGLALVSGVASRFGVKALPEGGKTVWAEIALPAALPGRGHVSRASAARPDAGLSSVS